MFAYCRNNPVSRKDVSGTDDIEVVDLDGNPTIDEDDIVGGGCDAQPVTGMCSGGVWSTFVTTMKNATKGLMMAMGEKEGTQEHHFFSNKNTVYTPRYEEIVVDKYGLDLNGKWNVRVLDNHRGRHTNKYHEFMECMLYEIDNIACGDLDEFLFGVGLLEDYIEGNAWIPYAR